MFQVMEQAAKQNPAFKFEYQSFSFGRLINKINGKASNAAENKYWMLYELKDKPKVNAKPGAALRAQFGVDGLIVKDNYNYLFWLQTVIY
jgi:hypothetical protein